MNHFILKLVDEFADSRYENAVSFYTVDTDKTLQEVHDAYEAARDEWYDDENGEFDCLIAHIEMRLEEQGMLMRQLDEDLELEF